MISFVKRAKYLVTSIWTWCNLRWCNYYFFAAFQIILSLACVSRETHKLSPSRVNIGASGPITKYIRQTLRYFLLSPNLARAQIDLASPSPRWVISFMLTEKCGKEFVAGFAKNESLYRRILTKYKWSKLFWRILEEEEEAKIEVS